MKIGTKCKGGDKMKIEKDELMVSLLQIFYEFAMECKGLEGTEEFLKGYRSGMLEIIEAVNKYTRE